MINLRNNLCHSNYKFSCEITFLKKTQVMRLSIIHPEISFFEPCTRLMRLKKEHIA